ncbi:MAG TPA: efflux transporter outer membrane subunit [Croceibacterium sp.]|nr:efflux transporter outer membrane subunit [Croceibacterium sp.]
MTQSFPARRRRAAWLLPALLTGACASVPDVSEAPAIRAPSEHAAAVALAGSQAAWPGDGWWHAYGDPQLARLIEQALADSPDLAAAAARMRAAEGYTQRASAALKPTVDAFAEPEFSRQSENNGPPDPLGPGGWDDRGRVGLTLSFDLDLWGKNRAAFRAAEADADAARFEMAEVRLGLTTGIASTYAELASLYARRDTLAGSVDLREQTATLVARRVEQGLDTQGELKQATARVSQARADLEATDEALALTRNALAALIGAGPDTALDIERPRLAALQTQGLPATASLDLIGRRPDIAAARARVEAADERVSEARAEFYPNVNLSALIGLQAVGLGNLFSGGSQFGSIGPAVSLPIFHGGALEGQYRGRRGQYDEAVAGYDGRVIAALRETADAVTSQRRLVSRLVESRRALADFEDANRLMRSRYEHGLASYLDVLSAEEGVLAARRTVAELETRAFTLDVALIRALGGGFAAA